MSGTFRSRRIISVVAATVISLACGTNYAYSAWAPEFARKLRLSATESNLIGLFGNLGMYASGVPVGMVVDNKGPRPGVFVGSILLGVGYFFQHRAFVAGPGFVGLPLLCIFSFLTGVGGCSAFLGAVKTAALNWPNHRGTATAFPLAAFGLSAFFFSLLSSLAFPDDTSVLLLLLSILTFAMPLGGGIFLQVVPQTYGYRPVPESGMRADSDTSATLKHFRSNESDTSTTLKHFKSNGSNQEAGTQAKNPKDNSSEHSSLLSNSSAGSGPGDVPSHEGEGDRRRAEEEGSHRTDVRGLAMLKHARFYLLWSLLGLLTGIGLMTINNIGNDVRAIEHHYDDSTTPKLIQERQLMHVEILSIMSFVGRLASGVGSDLIVHCFALSRYWVLVLSSLIFLLAQICGATIENPHALGLVSGLTGLAYGFLFGSYPALVAESFGVHGMSQNWGFMTLAPVVAGNIFNLLYGQIYDRHSFKTEDGVMDCKEGLQCYQAAYYVTLAAAVAGLVLSLGGVRWDWMSRRARGREKAVGREA